MPQDYLIGARLDEYRLETLLGRGGMARVYRAVDVNLNRSVAIKVIDIPHRAEAEYAQRFRREAQALARLDHPHIIRLYRYGEAQPGPSGDSVLYMAMQYIEGANLQYVLDSYRRDGETMEAAEIRRIIGEVCGALDYAHERGIVHRDVKPANILLDLQGRTILTDFGLTLLSTQTTRGEVFGSPGYIAPEQAVSSAQAVAQSDLYSVGVVLYEMLTGRLPFGAAQPLEQALMHINNPVPSPRTFRPEISAELEAVVLKALAKRPEDRYPSGQALADALDLALPNLAAAQPGLDPAHPAPRLPVAERTALILASQTPPATNPVMQPPVKENQAGQESAAPGVEATAARPNLPTVVPWKEGAAAAGGTAGPGPAAPVNPAGLPAAPRKRRASWALWATAALVLLLACFGAGAAFLSSRFLTGSAGVRTATPTAEEVWGTDPSATAEITPMAEASATQAPTEAGAAAGAYQFQINRLGESQAYFVLKNSGSVDLPMNGLSIRVAKYQVPGSAWGVEVLEPGECLFLRKEDRKSNSLPDGLPCVPAGKTLAVKKQMDGIFKEKITVFYGENEVGSCARDQQVCHFSFTE